MKDFAKKGTRSAIKLFQRSKILFNSKKDQKCKLFIFWAKTIKVAKFGVLTEKLHSGRANAVNKINFGLKLSFQQVYDTKSVKKMF